MNKRNKNESLRLTHPKVIIVEGADEVNIFEELLNNLNLQANFQIINADGKGNFPNILKTIMRDPGRHNLLSIGLIRDADKNASATFQSTCSALINAKLPKPNTPLQLVGNKPKVAILILPGDNKIGMLEDVCLASVKDTPTMACVENYFTCLEKNLVKLPHNQAKASVGAFLSSMAWLEIAHFEHLQKHLGDYLPELPKTPTPAKISAFLAAHSKPNLSLGIAAKKGYWNFNHPAFAQLKQFLQLL